MRFKRQDPNRSLMLTENDQRQEMYLELNLHLPLALCPYQLPRLACANHETDAGETRLYAGLYDLQLDSQWRYVAPMDVAQRTVP